MAMMDILHRPVCDLLGSRYPVVLAGMGGVARSELVAAVTGAGGFGFLGMVMQPVSVIRSEVASLRERGVGRFGVSLAPAATAEALIEAQVEACIELKVPVVCLFWDLRPAVARRLRDAGIIVVCQVVDLAEARVAEEAGARVLIAQGVEAAGQVRGERPLHDLIPEIVEQTDVPVLAAGALVSGGDLATVMSLGAQGAVFGRADRMREIAAEGEAELTSGAVTPKEPVQTTSPACSAHEMDDSYMGFADREALLPVLNELLEAERAGARVTLRTAREAPEALKPLVMAVHRDEARWCGVLTSAVQQLEGTPSQKVGAFHDKAMAIADIEPRLAFLNRGQGWVARKLEALLPTIRDDVIHADLAAMLKSHQSNIDLVNQRLAPPPSGPAS